MASPSLGDLVRSIHVPTQEDGAEIMVTAVDLHQRGFVVRCRVEGEHRLQPVGLVSLELFDDLSTRYEHADAGEDFIEYAPAIPQDAALLTILTKPPTIVPL